MGTDATTKPPPEAVARKIASLLAEQENAKLYAVLDAAHDPAIFPGIVDSGAECECLLEGQLGPELEQSAPYLVLLHAGDRLSRLLAEQGFGQSWGLYIAAPMTMQKLKEHLRTLLMVRTEKGESFFFRFYDPRVLRVFLPTCDGSDLAQVFGRIHAFYIETEDGQGLHVFTAQNGKLVARVEPVAG